MTQVLSVALKTTELKRQKKSKQKGKIILMVILQSPHSSITCQHLIAMENKVEAVMNSSLLTSSKPGAFGGVNFVW